MSHAMKIMLKVDAALAYASWGWKVLPVVPNNKIPATAHGVHDATTNAEQIKKWWTDNPEYNIGIATGEASGIVNFDIDPRNGGDDSWSKWLSDHSAPNDGICQLTAGGGQHHIAKWRDGIKTCELRPGIDLLANGRYFLAFPSTINGNTYEWEASSDPFEGVAPFDIPEDWMVSMAVRKVIATATNGELITGNRNAGLTAMAGSMRRNGFSSDEIYAAISTANSTRCDMPLPASEVRRIAQSVGRYDPEHDVGASAALGEDAAESLIKPKEIHPLANFIDYNLSQIPATEFVLDGIIQAGLVLIAGSAGAGKTTQLVPLMCRVAHLCADDDPLKPLLRRKVIWVSEDPNQVLKILRSMHEAGHLGGKSEQEVSEWFKIVPSARLAPQIVAQVAPLYESMFTPNISADGVVFEASPVVNFDTTNSTFDLENESDNSEVGKAMAILKQRFSRMALILIGHLAKALKRADVADFSARGAGAWEADANQVLYITKEDDGQRWLEVASAKHRFVAQADGILFSASINPIMTHDVLGNLVRETLIHGVPEVVYAGGKSQRAKEKADNKKAADKVVEEFAKQEKKDVILSALKVLPYGTYHTKQELIDRIKGKTNKAIELIEEMVKAREIDVIYMPFPSHIEKRPGRHTSGYVMPKSYKDESDGD